MKMPAILHRSAGNSVAGADSDGGVTVVTSLRSVTGSDPASPGVDDDMTESGVTSVRAAGVMSVFSVTSSEDVGRESVTFTFSEKFSLPVTFASISTVTLTVRLVLETPESRWEMTESV